jgi:transposase
VTWSQARPTQRLEVALDELRAVRRRIDQNEPILASDRPLLGALLSQQIGRAEGRAARLLAKLAASTAASQGTSVPPSDPKASDDAAASPAGSSSSSDAKATSSDAAASPAAESEGDDEEPEPEPGGDPKPKGHGRNGASAFRTAQHYFYALALGVIGAVCTACQIGKMYRYREKIIIRIVGQPMFRAEQHHHEQARCRNCGRVVRADGLACVHEGVGTEYIRYDWSACAMLLFMHYTGGDPFKRLESHHEGWGVPMPDANQWEVVDKADDLLLPLYRAIEQHAIQRATNFRIDDTGSVVITIKRQIEAELAALRAMGESTKGVRTGINATGIYWETPDGPVVLYYTGRHHAGEIIDQVLGRRLASRPTLVKCTDGASKNFDHAHADKLVEATCNAHALLKFRDIRDKYPAEYAEAGKVYSAVFDNDDTARALELSPIDRMLYHRLHSKPLMVQLKKMCEEKVASRSVEPNSPLWEPVTFILNQWERLTLFCEAPGVPLDTNLVEQALIVPVRYLAGSFNYHTENGAVVGDHAMSLIATARAHGVEPVAYLAECLRSHEDLAKRPEHYLPWVYRARNGGADAPARAAERAAEPEPSDARLRDLAPEIGEAHASRVPAPEQHLELAGEQRRAPTRPVAGGPPGEAALRQPLRAQPESGAVEAQNAEHVTATVPEDEERAVHRVLLEHEAGDRRGAIDARPEVDRVVHHHDRGIRRNLDHRAPPAPRRAERSPRAPPVSVNRRTFSPEGTSTSAKGRADGGDAVVAISTREYPGTGTGTGTMLAPAPWPRSA